MKEALPKLKLKTLKASPSATSSPESVAGLSPCNSQESTTKKPLWTGSPPCQPFSAAGKQLGQFDPRHLAPVFLNLISQCRPAIIFGEQVAPAIAKSWMCDLQTHLEGEDYAVGFAVLPACSVGAPHKRDRLFFGAVAHTLCEQFDRRGSSGPGRRTEPTDSSEGGGLAYTDDSRLERRQGVFKCADKQSAGTGGVESELADTATGGRGEECQNSGRFIVGDSAERRPAGRSAGGGDNPANSHHSFWSDADWLGCRDGKFRPVEPGTFPLANGIPARVGRLRVYGNAIVPEVAAEFVRAFLAASDDTING